VPARWDDPRVASADRSRDRSDARPDLLDMARRIVLGELKGHPVRVFLFGSRARGQSAPGSDIDIALLADARLPRTLLSRVRESLEESTIPVHVDVVDLAAAADAFRRAVLAEAVEWTV
jgi:hypothetical protein